MSCAACVRRVENALNAVRGVENAAVNLATSRATVVYSPALADWQALRTAIEQAGYDYLGVYDEEAGDLAETARRARTRRFETQSGCGCGIKRFDNGRDHAASSSDSARRPLAGNALHSSDPFHTGRFLGGEPLSKRRGQSHSP